MDDEKEQLIVDICALDAETFQGIDNPDSLREKSVSELRQMKADLELELEDF